VVAFAFEGVQVGAQQVDGVSELFGDEGGLGI
jgi:hypothetical protein